MSLLIQTNAKKYGDLDKGDTIYYIHPHLRIIEPAFILGTDMVFEKPNLKKFTVLLIPKEDREKPINSLDTSKMRQVIFNVEKNATMCMVLTNPPSVYCTTEKELQTWMQFT